MASADFRVALEVLRDLYRETAAGSGRLALVSGGLSIGKTRLLHALSQHAAESGALVLMAIGSRTERHVQGGVAYQLFRSSEIPAESQVQAAGALTLQAEQSDSPQDIGSIRPAEIDSARTLCDTLLELARRRHVVICVDDVQFADRSSLQLLLHLRRRLAHAPVLMVLTCWEWPRPNLPLFHAEMTRLPHHPIRLRPLTPPAVEELVREALGEEAAEQLGPAVHRCSGGNPLLANALIDDHRHGELLQPADGGGPLITGQAYRQAVLTCLHRWDPLLLRAAQGIAALGDHADRDGVAELLDLPPESATHAVDVLESAGLLEEGRFRAPAGREAVLDSLAPGERRSLHLKAAELLRRRCTPATAVADHLVAADEVPASSTAVLREAAEEALAADDPASAVRYLELALSAELSECERVAVIEAIACAKWRINPSVTSLYARQLRAALADGTLSPRGAEFLFRHALLQGDTTDLPRALGALKSAGERTDGRLAAELALACHWVFGRSEESLPGLGAGDASLRGGPTDPADDPWAGVAHAVALGGPYADRDTAVLAAERILHNCRLSDATLPALATALNTLAGAHEAEKAAHWCDSLIAEATRRRATTWRAMLEGVRAHIALSSGALATAAAHAEEALTLVSPSGWGVLVGCPLSCLVQANVVMERFEAAAAALRQRVPPAMFDTMFGVHYLRARGRYHLATNGVLAATSDFRTAQETLTTWGRSGTTMMRLLTTDLAEANLMLGHHATARDLVTEQLRSAAQIDSRVRAISLRLLARCIPPTQRPATLKQAVRCAQAAGDRHELARILDDLGRAYQELGDGERAREVFRRAVQETRACLTGPALPEQPPHGPAVGAPDGRPKAAGAPILSEAEHRVAVLAARGHTNRAIGRRLYITVSTVEQHLTRVYKKLGVNGRGDLAAGMASHGVPEAGLEEEKMAARGSA